MYRITRTELSARHAGSLLGAAWVFVGPLLILAIYGVVYTQIFRFQPPGLTQQAYVLYIFAGLVPFLSTAESLNVAVGSVAASKAVITNTVFPIDLIPVKAVLMSLGTMLVGLVTVLVGSAATGELAATAPLLVPLVALHYLALIGVAWVISLLNVVMRDMQNLIAALLLVLLIASPIAYTPEMVPSTLQPLLDANPFSYYVRAYQDVLVLGEIPSVGVLAGVLLSTAVMFCAGSWLFHRARRVIVDYV